MKKSIAALALMLVLLTGVACAQEFGVGVRGFVGNQNFFNTPAGNINLPQLFVVSIADTWDISAGYASYGAGDGVDANNSLMLEGTWYILQNSDVKWGPSVTYLNATTATALSPDASDNNVNVLSVGWTAKKQFAQNFEARLDASFFQMLFGESGGADIEDANVLLPAIAVSAVLYIL